jgi:hypothetical protein
VSAIARKALTLLFSLLSRAKRPPSHTAVLNRTAREFMTIGLEREGRWPMAEELAAMLGIPLDVALSLRDQVLVDQVLDEQAAGSKGGTAAIRQLEQAVRCLPPSQRARYRQEWRAEMASLPIVQWAPYAIGVLRSSPGLSVALSWRVGKQRPA